MPYTFFNNMRKFCFKRVPNSFLSIFIFLALMSSLLLQSCAEEDTPEPITPTSSLKDKQDSVSYFVGMKMASKFKTKEPNFRQLEIPIIVNGFKHFLKGDTTLSCRALILNVEKQRSKSMTKEILNQLSFCFGKLNALECTKVFKEFNASQKMSNGPLTKGFEDGILGKNNLIDSDEAWIYTYEQFITQCNMDNEKRLFQKAYENKSIITLDSNVLLEIISPGVGEFVNTQDEVKFHFIKFNALGDTLLSSFQHKEKGMSPRISAYQELEIGLKIAFLKMKPGGKYKLFIPGNLSVLENQRYQALSYEIDLIASTKKSTFVQKSSD